MIRTVFFDMGNVLLFFSHARMCAQIGALCGWSGEDIARLVIDSRLQWEFEAGRLTPQEFHAELEKLTDRRIDVASLERAASDIFELNTDILPLLDELRQHNIRLVLLSNTCITHYRWIEERFDVLQRFDACVTSFEVGALKPETAIYEAALSAAQAPPEQCFYTDDLSHNIEAARRFGIRADVFRDTAALIEHLRDCGVPLSKVAAS